jgi:sec-independent protein translocase protein TatA
MEQMIPLFGPIPGGMEMMVILLIAVLLFGAAMGEFKKGRQEVEEELQEMQEGGTESLDTESTDTVTDTEPATDTETSTDTE